MVTRTSSHSPPEEKKKKGLFSKFKKSKSKHHSHDNENDVQSSASSIMSKSSKRSYASSRTSAIPHPTSKESPPLAPSTSSSTSTSHKDHDKDKSVSRASSSRSLFSHFKRSSSISTSSPTQAINNARHPFRSSFSCIHIQNTTIETNLPIYSSVKKIFIG
ncbi:unnamed protein product [Ambrosiozyma monospora]|uniref:Unnamed protein product n=1 Tax=Ambrosiozyma monospora TaxID=43982 RepID=A0ACB5TSJ5_AMBMO|nr:unnamed protein product [Ambrosiozyma monospora]